jgi:membrane protein
LPLCLIVAIAVAGLFFGRDAAQDAIVAQLGNLLGDTGQTAIDEMLASMSELGGNMVSLIVGIGALMLGATTALSQNARRSPFDSVPFMLSVGEYDGVEA